VVARRNWFGPALVLLLLLLGEGLVAPAHSDDRKAAATQAQLDSETDAAILKREQEYRVLFDSMDKKHNKIARALKEYADPKTSDAKKIKLQTYLRQTSVDRPEDKMLLRGASLDPQYASLLPDIHMALLHAIQVHPEESDKEFLLDLLRKKIAPGWLMYTMLKVWDERYVPFLLEYAKEGDDVSVEILGRMKVAAAVPVLEQVLKDEGISWSAKGTALDSLFLITGKQYKVVKQTP
jgi:hypothetical protein